MDQINLEQADDLELVKKIQKYNCSDSIKELDRRHSPLCFNIYGRFSKSFESLGLNKEDIINDRLSIIYKAAQTYRNNKNTKFSTWLGNRIRYQCHNEINRQKRRVSTVEENQIIQICSFDIKEEFKDHIFKILEDRPDYIQLLKWRFMESLTLKEIGQKLNFSSEWIRNLINNVILLVRNRIKMEEL